MKTRLLTGLLVAALTASAPALAKNDDDLAELQQRLGNEWVLIKNDRLRHIKTWVKQEDDKLYRSFKVEATLTGSMHSYVRVLLDIENYTKWWWEVLEAKQLKQVSPTEYYVYFKHRAPYGVPNRDIPGVISYEPQTPTNRSLVVRVKAMPDYLPEAPPFVRMKAEDMVVKLTPLGKNTIAIQAEGYVDPGGQMPNWAINFVQRSAPYRIVVGMQRMLDYPQYVQAKTPLPFSVYEADN